jgi:hypothetical protein
MLLRVGNSLLKNALNDKFSEELRRLEADELSNRQAALSIILTE